MRNSDTSTISFRVPIVSLPLNHRRRRRRNIQPNDGQQNFVWRETETENLDAPFRQVAFSRQAFIWTSWCLVVFSFFFDLPWTRYFPATKRPSTAVEKSYCPAYYQSFLFVCLYVCWSAGSLLTYFAQEIKRPPKLVGYMGLTCWLELMIYPATFYRSFLFVC